MKVDVGGEMVARVESNVEGETRMAAPVSFAGGLLWQDAGGRCQVGQGTRVTSSLIACSLIVKMRLVKNP